MFYSCANSLVSVYKLTVSKKVVISRQGGESRVPGEKRDPALEMVPDFRRDDVWMPHQVRHDMLTKSKERSVGRTTQDRTDVVM